jgi:thioredoxin-related protein
MITKTKNIYCTLVLVALLISWMPESIASAGDVKKKTAPENINWYAYKDGMTQGKKNGKKIFINFRADWCGWCRKMEKDTLKDPLVVSYLNKNFISIKVDTDKQKDLAEKYGVRGLPLNWFIEGNGEPIGSRPGYIDAEMLLSILKSLNEPVQSEN